VKRLKPQFGFPQQVIGVHGFSHEVRSGPSDIVLEIVGQNSVKVFPVRNLCQGIEVFGKCVSKESKQNQNGDVVWRRSWNVDQVIWHVTLQLIMNWSEKTFVMSQEKY
jgi:hypothetical protein